MNKYENKNIAIILFILISIAIVLMSYFFFLGYYFTLENYLINLLVGSMVWILCFNYLFVKIK